MLSQTHLEFQEVLESLNTRVDALHGTVLGVAYDKRCKIELVVKLTFGPQCQSLMEKYHFYQRILTTVVGGVKNSHYKDVAAALRSAIVKTPATNNAVAVCWSAEEQLRKMGAVQDHFRKVGNVWTRGPGSSETVWNTQLAHVKKGCLSPHPTIEKLRTDESRIELWHYTLKGIPGRVVSGIINMHHQLHDAHLRRNLRVGAKAGKRSRLHVFRLTA